jgi:hypothetical protein
MDDETIAAIPYSAMAIPDAPRDALPCQLPAMPSNLKAVREVLRFRILAHEPEECHVHRGHTEPESFEMQAEMLPEAMEDLLHFATNRAEEREGMRKHSLLPISDTMAYPIHKQRTKENVPGNVHFDQIPFENNSQNQIFVKCPLLSYPIRNRGQKHVLDVFTHSRHIHPMLNPIRMFWFLFWIRVASNQIWHYPK